MLLMELRKSGERVGLGINGKPDLGLAQLKCQQNSHMKMLTRQLVKEDYSLGERLFLPGRFRSHLQRGGIRSSKNR